MAEHTPEVEALLRKAFSAFVKRTHVRFAPYIDAVDDAYRVWLVDHPEEVRAAHAACHAASGLNVTGDSHG